MAGVLRRGLGAAVEASCFLQALEFLLLLLLLLLLLTLVVVVVRTQEEEWGSRLRVQEVVVGACGGWVAAACLRCVALGTA